MNVLKNRAECMNKVREYHNEITPLILAELRKGFSITSKNQLFKKDKERLRSILDKKPIFSSYISVSEYSRNVWLNIKDHYQTGECTCAYYEVNIYLYDGETVSETPKPYEMVTEQQLIAARARINQLSDEISDRHSEKSKLELLVSAY